MTSTTQDRLELVQAAYEQAYARRAADLAAAASDAEADAVIANIEKLDAAYLDAALQLLDQNGPAVEAAYDAAVAAQAAVDRALRDAQSLAVRIGLVGDLAGKIGELVRTASGRA